MKLFWKGKREIPTDAAFGWYPFFPEKLRPFDGAIERVHALPSPLTKIEAKGRVTLPSKEVWRRGVESALEKIRQSQLEKIVLARQVTWQLPRAIDPLALVAALEQRASDTVLFCLSQGKSAFLGATPELLFAREEAELTTMVLAGTRRRGKTPFEEAVLEQELTTSDKDYRECSPIERHLQERLAPLVQKPLLFSPLSVYKSSHVQHLYSKGTGTLRLPYCDKALLEAIHPTPALCGTPYEAAAPLIRELEPFKRGLYGGAIGWSTPSHAEWAVAIRSCRIEGNEIHLFSGAGIVEGSDPDREWEELDAKIALYEELFS